MFKFACCSCGRASNAEVAKLENNEVPAEEQEVDEEEEEEVTQKDRGSASPARTASTQAPAAQDCVGTAVASDSPVGTPEPTHDEIPSDANVEDAKLSALDRRAVLLDEDTAVFDLDVRRREAAQAVLPSLRQHVAGLLSRVADGALRDAERFCSDDTLLRYLITCDSNVDKAARMLKATVEWRPGFFKGVDMSSLGGGSRPPKTLCPCCASDPSQHCFLRLGTDAAGREVIYSCAGRASNKGCSDGMLHMALELERIFGGNSLPGQVVWVHDFSGFGISDCSPRAGLSAVPLFANHYPERFAHIVLFGMPAIAMGMCSVILKLVDPITRSRVVILKREAERKRYMDAYWSCDPALSAWLQAVQSTRGAPRSYPDLMLSRALKDDAAVEMLGRCAALQKLRQ